MEGNIFLHLSVLLAVTATAAFALRLLRQPLVVSYLVAGVLAGPLALDLMRGDEALYRAFANFGVVLLLFVVGLSLNVRHLREIGRSALMAGVGQVLFTAVVGFMILILIPMPMAGRAYLAVAITFSSTIIIVKLLTDKGHVERLYGRHVIGLMIVQDLLALALLVVAQVVGVGDATAPAVTGLALRVLGVVAMLALLTRYILPAILDYAARSGEHLFLTTIAWCFGVAAAVHWAGFSLELGALAAGITLAASPYQPEIASRVRPLRDFFLVLFFLILGATMRLTDVAPVVAIGALLSAFILIGNPVILYIIYRWLGFTRRNSFLAGVTAAQVSEFGFVLLLVGERLGHVGGDTLAAFTLTALVTIVASTYLVTYNEQLFQFLHPFLRRFGSERHQSERTREVYDAWLFGYHRIGWKVAEALQTKDVRFAVVDDNPDAIRKLRGRGIPVHFGDASDVEFLESLPLASANLVVSTIPDLDAQLVLIRHLRAARNTDARFIATANHARDLQPLYDAGADFVVMPHLLGGVWLSEVITGKPWTATTFARLRKEQTEEMRLRTAHATA